MAELYAGIIDTASTREEARRRLNEAGVPRTTLYRMLNRRFPRRKSDKPEAKPSGVALRSARVSFKKPSTSIAGMFNTLEKGRAYLAEELAAFWGFSTDSIYRAAKGSNLMVYVEDENTGQWTRCVVSPETAKDIK